MRKFLSLFLVFLLVSNTLFGAVIPSGTIISNGGISTDNVFDSEGETILTYEAFSGTITCAAVTSTVGKMFGISGLVSDYPDVSASQGSELYFLYRASNTGNTPDFFTVNVSTVQGSGWAFSVIADENQDGVHSPLETTVISGLSSGIDETATFFINAKIPGEALHLSFAQAAVAIRANNGSGGIPGDGYGNNDEIQDVFNITCLDTAAPGAVTDLSAWPGEENGSIKLSWTMPADDGTAGILTSAKYRVFYSSTVLSEAGWVFTDNVEYSTATRTGMNMQAAISGLVPGATYYVRISVRDEVEATSHWSALSAPATGYTTTDSVSPAPVTDLSATPGVNEGEILLTWTDPGDDSLSGELPSGRHKIYISTNDISDLAALPFPAEIRALVAGLSPGGMKTYTVTGLIPSATYYFAVQAGDEAPNWSPWSIFNANALRVSSAKDTVPAEIQNLSVSFLTLDSILLSWAPAQAPDIAGYRIYSDTTTPYGDSFTVLADTAGPGFLISLLPDLTYYFGVKAYDRLMQESTTFISMVYAFVPRTDTVPPAVPAMNISGDLKFSGDNILFYMTAPSSDIAQVTYRYKESGAATYYDLASSTAYPYTLNLDLQAGATIFTEGKTFELLISFSDPAMNISTKTITFTLDREAPDLVTKNISRSTGTVSVFAGGQEIIIVSTSALAGLAVENLVIMDTDAIKAGDISIISKIESANNRALLNEKTGLDGKNSFVRAFEAVTSTGGIIKSNFREFVRLKIPYPDEDNDGIVDGLDLAERTLKIYRLNETGGIWEPVSDLDESGRRGLNKANFTENYVTAEVMHFSVYTIIGLLAPDLENLAPAGIRVFPNPYKKGSSPDNNIKFIRLSKTSRVRIYTLSGEPVRELTRSDWVSESLDYFGLKWDLKNASGETVADGIYVYTISDDKGTYYVGKLVILLER